MPEQRHRLYDAILRFHLAHDRQMAFLAGPRQTGKTTTAKGMADVYFDWDNVQHAELIAAGPERVHAQMPAPALGDPRRTVVFDEIHKFGRWKQFLKGFYDTHGDHFAAIVTGSSRLDVYRRGGDSLMGRYFLYRMHPFSVAEIANCEPPEHPIRPPTAIPEEEYQALWQHGGFPAPFLRRTATYSRRWQRQRLERFLQEDLRDLTRIQELGQLELLAQLLMQRSGKQVVYSNLAADIRIAQDTVRRWLQVLCSLHVGFLVRPWHRNISKALRKEPKWYLRDWSGIEDPGSRAETFIACQLLKAVEGWTDLGLGEFSLHYLRDKRKREVDFLIARDGRPWFLVEVKTGDDKLSPGLSYFQRASGADHAFQVVIDREYVPVDCFSRKDPVVVPARTLLAQLL